MNFLWIKNLRLEKKLEKQLEKQLPEQNLPAEDSGESEFARTELLLGEAGLRRLMQSTVMVLGVGGVGSHCIEALARSGVGRLILVDNDRVSISNINRQSIALHSTIGRYKTEVMKEKIADICPQTEVITYCLSPCC